MTPRLVATDLDGTLLDSEGQVSARTRAVLDELDATGVPVVFTTGRPIRWMEGLWDAVGGHGLAICSNGGIVYDVAARQVRDHWPVTREVGLALAEAVRAAVPGTTFAIEHISGWASEVDFPTHPDDREERTQGAWEDIFRDDVVKVLAVHRDLDPEVFWSRVAEAVGDSVVTTWSSSFALVEISAAGVTKATTLARVAAEMGLGPEHVVAFGDMPNDLPMLEWAGTSYAMANAHETVQELADHLAPTNDDDGVATVLTELFDLSR
ncbi:Cof subfamily protein (haloacid dehalogenase superfamily) [Nocardioides sp. BE266]|uniref:Cof-type HAD-IIB family hydrolase n=1 Tax=Nocardioides sp. BE266 TaxID=2817725 RepID=UPI00285FF1C1|nr:HAD family hydrolase [Nocardioides sp. BE266]MDR7252928.1 Cof subfamily protein (haloacid dehalogenase superfamily) [Nocardioides sp. BE266]